MSLLSDSYNTKCFITNKNNYKQWWNSSYILHLTKKTDKTIQDGRKNIIE